MIKRLKSIIKQVNNIHFYHKDGYHHLPFIGDSPGAMLEGFKSMPFVTFDEENRVISTDNPFIRNKVHYTQLETGLWLFIHNAYFKANICGKAIYEQQGNCEYFSLYYNINKSKIKTQNIRFKDILVNSRHCTLHRPGSDICAYIPKGTHATVVNFLFNRDWAVRNINYGSLPSGNPLKSFFEQHLELVVSTGLNTDVVYLIESICDILGQGSKNPLQAFQLKAKANELMMGIIDHFGSELQGKYNSSDYKMISIIEAELSKTLRSHFPGLEVFAKACNCSISKVKYVAEQFYGKGGISTVHQAKRMELAKKMLELNSGKYIKEVAFELGYETPGKFSEAYKKHFGVLPTMAVSTKSSETVAP